MRIIRALSLALLAAGISLAMTVQPSIAMARTWTKVVHTTMIHGKPYTGTGAASPHNPDASPQLSNEFASGSRSHLDPRLKADLDEQMRNPQFYTSSADREIRQGVAAGPEDWMTLDQCKGSWPTLHDDSFWFYKNHFSACQITHNIIQFLTCTQGGGCRETGRTTVDVAFIGSLSHTTRKFDWTVYLYDWKTTGAEDSRRTLAIYMDCNTYNDNGVCNADPMWGFTKTLAEWRTTASVKFTYDTSTPSPVPNDPHPQDKIAHFRFAPQVQAEGPTSTPPYPFTIVRCDNASYITGAGCTFTGVLGTFQFDYNQASYKESVEFIWTAMHHLDQVKPDSVGLYVPGGAYVQPLTGHKEPLTRNYYGNQSRTRVVAECVRLYGPNYTQRPDGDTNDCDEYPFATTYQSANFDTDGTAATWAVKPVHFSQNRSAGSIFGKWYKSDHLLDGDGFYISIINAPDN